MDGRILRAAAPRKILAGLGSDSERGALDDAAVDAPPAPVVELGGARMGVPSQILDILERHVLGQQVRDDQDPERVWRENLREAAGLEPALEHHLHGERRHAPFGERSPSGCGR